MSRRKLSPLVEAINAYNSLDDRDKATFADYVRSQTPKSRARNAGKPSSPRARQQASTPNTGEDKANAIAASN